MRGDDFDSLFTRRRKPPRGAAFLLVRSGGGNFLVEDCADGVVGGEEDLATVGAGRGDGSERDAVVRPAAEVSGASGSGEDDRAAHRIAGDADRTTVSCAG